MKRIALVPTLALTAVALASPSLAQTTSRSSRPSYDQGSTVPPAPADVERGTVLSVTPIVQQVAMPRRACRDEAVAVQRPPSGAGAVIGAIAGGAIGNSIGGGAGRAAATAIGVIGGAAVGNSIESGGQPSEVQTVRRCTTETEYVDRMTAYRVVYEYAGRQYTTQMRQDPGSSIDLHVRPVSETGALPPPQYVPPARVSSAPPVYVERPVYETYPDVVVQTYPAPAPVYYGPAYPQFGTGLVLGALIGYGASYGYGRHWHGGHGYHRGR
jgi:uncharacterized protein YcfJ